MLEIIDTILDWPYLMFVFRLFPTVIIFKKRLLGGVLFMFMDLLDYQYMVDHMDPFNMERYQMLDKLFDTYYHTLEAFIIFRYWKDVKLRRIGLGLYIYRVIGIILFELTQLRILVILFTNLFEYYYLAIEAVSKVKTITNPVKTSIIILAFLLPGKAYQELYLHGGLGISNIIGGGRQNYLWVLITVAVIYLEFFHKKKESKKEINAGLKTTL